MNKDSPDQLSRRQALLAAATLSAASVASSRAAFASPESWRKPGKAFGNYGQPHPSQASSIRWISNEPAMLGNGVSWTPLHELEGTITPNGLHFERHHNGVPDINPDVWTLSIEDAQATVPTTVLNLAELSARALVSNTGFLECGGNSNSLWYPTAVQAPAGFLHGLVSQAEWTGVPLADVLGERYRSGAGQWLIATGLDASGVTVSLPLDAIIDRALVALYQNGERLRPENGFPARLFLPGWEGITNVKWLGRLLLSDRPAMSRFDTVSYTDLQADGRSRRFTREMGVKSVITSPTAGHELSQGIVQVSGLAWSGSGRIRQVDVSVDGGRHWSAATLQGPVLDRALTRFRYPWTFTGKPTVFMSRATDEQGRVQPTRAALLDEQGANAYYHYNAINTWAVGEDGRISHVYV